MKTLKIILGVLLSNALCQAQHEHHMNQPDAIPIISGVEVQPLLAQAVRLNDALDFIGSALPNETKSKLSVLQKQTHDPAIGEQIQALLDPFCLHTSISTPSQE